MPGSAATSLNASDALREAGFVDARARGWGKGRVGGKRHGSGENEAAVGVALTMAIEFFSLNKRSGQMDIALMLRRVLVEGETVRAAAAAVGITARQGYRLVREFKTVMKGVCERNMLDVSVVLG